MTNPDLCPSCEDAGIVRRKAWGRDLCSPHLAGRTRAATKKQQKEREARWAQEAEEKQQPLSPQDALILMQRRFTSWITEGQKAVVFFKERIDKQGLPDTIAWGAEGGCVAVFEGNFAQAFLDDLAVMVEREGVDGFLAAVEHHRALHQKVLLDHYESKWNSTSVFSNAVGGMRSVARSRFLAVLDSWGETKEIERRLMLWKATHSTVIVEVIR